MTPYRRSVLILAATAAILSHAAYAVTEKEAAAAERAGNFAAAASAYRTLVAQNPRSVSLRLQLADALAKDRRWDEAVAEYETVLRLQPDNAVAQRGIGTVRRWQGHLDEARIAYNRARAMSPNDPSAVLGLAATHALDRDFAGARKLYDEAARKWPQDTEVRQAAYDFRRRASPRVYVFLEDDLSFEARQVGGAAPVGAREEFGAEYQEESSLQSATGAKVYTRTDQKLLYTHFFGFQHALDASMRRSSYEYAQPVTAFSAIDGFEEYRVRYTFPLIPEQVAALRYTLRPTTLKLSQQSFNSHKLEAELTSRWTPRFQTLLGTGWLRDLDENATTTSNLRNSNLVKAGFQADVNNRIQVSGKYITNPDLDNTIDDMLILQADYIFTPLISGLARYRADNYKQGADQTSYYFGLRFVPDSHWWTEFGAKFVERGAADGAYALASVVYRF